MLSATVAFVSTFLFAPHVADALPVESAWLPLGCPDGVAIDPTADVADAPSAMDLIGTSEAAALMVAADATSFYFRLRLAGDPMEGGTIRPHVWGLAFDLDGQLDAYERLLVVDASPGNSRVALYENSGTPNPGDPIDSADDPPLVTWPLSGHVHDLGNAQEGQSGFLLEVEVPWADLEAHGLSRRRPTVVWAGTSFTSARLDGDLMCHDERMGVPKLDQIGRLAILDPLVDRDGDGFSDDLEWLKGTDPQNPGSWPAGQSGFARSFGGDGGCSAANGGRKPGGALLLLLLLALHSSRSWWSSSEESRFLRWSSGGDPLFSIENRIQSPSFTPSGSSLAGQESTSSSWRRRATPASIASTKRRTRITRARPASRLPPVTDAPSLAAPPRPATVRRPTLG
jgi:hypothetical protein